MTLYADSKIAIEQMKKDGGHSKALFDDLEFDVYPGHIAPPQHAASSTKI